MTAGWRWITPALVYAIHDRQLAEHGGAPGIRDQGAIESALARPCNLAAYSEADTAALAAAYAFGVVRNHGFVDGNKRTAWIVARVFLADNACAVSVQKAEAVRMMELLAAGTITEADFAAWLRERSGDG